VALNAINKPMSFETGGTMGYNCCFFLNFVPLRIESPYNFGGKKPSAEGKWACCLYAAIRFTNTATLVSENN
jgi:hypothetical protein